MAEKTEVQDASDDLKQLITDLQSLLQNSGTASPAATDLLNKISDKAQELHEKIPHLAESSHKPT